MLLLRLLGNFFPLWRWFPIPLPAIQLPEQRREYFETSEEFFDLESSFSFSEVPETFYTPSGELQLVSISVSTTLSTRSEDNISPPEAVVQPEETPEVERKHLPVLVISFVVINIGIFIITMYVNNCTKHTLPTAACFPHFLGRLSFQPTDQNPLYGPSRETLIKMGGLYLGKVLHRHQVWRLLTNIWLHEGFTQLLTDIVTICGVGIELEQKFGSVRVGSVYLISGLGGSLASALFIQSRVTVGASGALAGLTGASIAKSFIEYWTLQLPLMGFDLALAVSMMVVNVVVTIVQHGDNFANLGGTIIGAFLGFAIFTRPPLNRLRSTALLIVIFVGLLIGMTMVLKGVNLNDHCSWCHYLDCIPFPGWSCKYRGIDCDFAEIGNSLSMTCKSTGKTRIFPLKNGIPPHPMEDLCSRLCQA